MSSIVNQSTFSYPDKYSSFDSYYYQEMKPELFTIKDIKAEHFSVKNVCAMCHDGEDNLHILAYEDLTIFISSLGADGSLRRYKYQCEDLISYSPKSSVRAKAVAVKGGLIFTAIGMTFFLEFSGNGLGEGYSRIEKMHSVNSGCLADGKILTTSQGYHILLQEGLLYFLYGEEKIRIYLTGDPQSVAEAKLNDEEVYPLIKDFCIDSRDNILAVLKNKVKRKMGAVKYELMSNVIMADPSGGYIATLFPYIKGFCAKPLFNFLSLAPDGSLVLLRLREELEVLSVWRCTKALPSDY